MERNDFSIFTFETIIFLSNRDLWLLLAETDNVTILQACQRADDLILIRIRSVFTKTACDYFNDDLSKYCSAAEFEISHARERMAQTLSDLHEQGRLQDWYFKFAN